MGSILNPITIEDLLKQLLAIYPDKVPDIRDSDRDIWMKVGQQQVIRYIETLLEED